MKAASNAALLMQIANSERIRVLLLDDWTQAWLKFEHGLQNVDISIIFGVFISFSLIEPGPAYHHRRPGSFILAESSPELGDWGRALASPQNLLLGAQFVRPQPPDTQLPLHASSSQAATNFGTIARNARDRWLNARFTCGPSSPNVRWYSTTSNTGSYPKPLRPACSNKMRPRQMSSLSARIAPVGSEIVTWHT